ncbi:MAG: aminotransferase class I/II-fold pyridoxal phosphate-dependent enzyme [Micromonosporaceae bacterium]|nr:aminotransferase class I/II-fold pyridoxal phosphate-dependent enzyme [Micromonosporaceae bacterium]
MSPASHTGDLDAVTAPDLRERGSLKWTGIDQDRNQDQDQDTIGAWVAEMDFGTAPEVTAALHAAVQDGRFGYLPPGRRADLALTCAQWQQRRYGWAVAPEQVQPVSDVLTALELTIRHFTRPGSPVILPTPAYMPFLTTPPLHGRAVLEVPMATDGGQYVLDLDGLDRAYRAGGQLLILCNPANPVGRVLTAGELAAVTAVVDRHGGRVFADEIHAPLVYPGHRHVPYASTSGTAAGHTLTATAASKAWDLPGLKCGQVITSNQADAAAWEVVGSSASVAASQLGAVAATAAYRSGERWLDGILGYLDRSRLALGELLAAHLPELGYRPPEGTYLAWLDCRALAALDGTAPGGGDPAEFFRRHAGVAVVDGAECGQAGRGYVRLNFATPLPILRQAVTRMAEAAAGQRR